MAVTFPDTILVSQIAMAYEGKCRIMNIALRGYSVALLLLAVFFSGCGGSFQTGGDIAQGRQAMFRGDNQAALGYFQAAEKTDPSYIWGTELREGTLSFLGRAQYLNGQLAPARDTLQKALVQHQSDNLARLYLGLTLARQGDRQAGLRDIEAGLKGIRDFSIISPRPLLSRSADSGIRVKPFENPSTPTWR